MEELFNKPLFVCLPLGVYKDDRVKLDPLKLQNTSTIHDP